MALGPGLVSAALLIAVWAVAAILTERPQHLPSPVAVFRVLGQLIGSGELWLHVGMTLFRVTAAFVAAMAGMQVAVVCPTTLLARQHFSPGEIDGKGGTNTRRAVAAFQTFKGLPSTGELDAATWQALGAEGTPALVLYTLTDADVAGPFVRVPKDMMQQAKLESLGYGSVEERLGEKFHAAPALLKALNPGKNLSAAGTQIAVPNDETNKSRAIHLLASAGLLALSVGAAQAEYVLHVLHTNDFHSGIEPINKYDSTCDAETLEKKECFGGVARMAAAIAAATDLKWLSSIYAGVDGMPLALLAERGQLARDVDMDDLDRSMRELTLDNLPDSPAAAVTELNGYDWASLAQALVADENVRRLYLGESFSL